jgi:hypothetical protein
VSETKQIPEGEYERLKRQKDVITKRERREALTSKPRDTWERVFWKCGR